MPEVGIQAGHLMKRAGQLPAWGSERVTARQLRGYCSHELAILTMKVLQKKGHGLAEPIALGKANDGSTVPAGHLASLAQEPSHSRLCALLGVVCATHLMTGSSRQKSG